MYNPIAPLRHAMSNRTLAARLMDEAAQRNVRTFRDTELLLSNARHALIRLQQDFIAANNRIKVGIIKSPVHSTVPDVEITGVIHAITDHLNAGRSPQTK